MASYTYMHVRILHFMFCVKVKNLYKAFMDVDCVQLEVNPLAETPQGMVRLYLFYKERNYAIENFIRKLSFDF